jgi:DNA-binding transcriptional LysR family regulator
MDWDNLRIFLALRRTGTFAGAGRELGVNATTIARRLTAFEEEISAQLFARTTDGLVPTAAAETIAPSAELIERNVQLIERDVGGHSARLSGLVRLTVTEHFAANFLVDHLGSFRRAFPDIEIDINTSLHMVDIARGQADIAVRFRSPNTGPGVQSSGGVEVRVKRVGTVGIGVYGSTVYLERAGRPTSAHAVQGHSVVMPREDAMFLPGASWCESVRDQVSVALRCDGLAGIAAAGAAGFGLCALPTFVAMRHKNLKRISPPNNVGWRDAWLLMPEDMVRVARVRKVWEYLIELFSAWEPLLTGEVTLERPNTSA